ncbi:hypothetical protein PFISCL1PPCAC_3017, partial [Pristionchus fissidentatus]
SPHLIMRTFITLYLLVIASFADDLNLKEVYQNPLSNGIGEEIAWVKWDDAIEKALDEDKPIFLLIHKMSCHACRVLKKTFSQSNARKAFKALSQYFIMVNTADEDELYEEEYSPDGKYVPRVLFLDKNGDLLAQFKNKKGVYKNYAYYYSSPADILNSMKDVLKHYKVEVPELKRGDKLKKKTEEKKELKKDEKKEEKK